MGFGVLSTVFCAIFVLELALRIFVYRGDFFTASAWQWNWLDLAVVTLQLIEEIIRLATGAEDYNGVGALRILRGARLIRIARIVRVLHLLRELRSMISSIVCTIRSLFWTVVLLTLVVYMYGAYLTQLVSQHGYDHPDDVAEGTTLHMYYGSVGRSLFTLFMSVSGGIDWNEACEPLMTQISPAFGFGFSCYVSFMLFSMLNVITGIFVESALKHSKEEIDADMVSYLQSVFTTPDLKMPGRITWPEFKEKLGHRSMRAYFKSIDLDVSEAKFLFELLDLHGTGSVDAEDFVMGCRRLRGPATAIDLATLLSETRRLKLHLYSHSAAIEDLFANPDSPYAFLSRGQTFEHGLSSVGNRNSSCNQGADCEAFAPAVGLGGTGFGRSRKQFNGAESGPLFARLGSADSDMDPVGGPPPPPKASSLSTAHGAQ